MRRIRNKYVNEFYDRANTKQRQYSKKTYTIALIPTLLLTVYILSIPANWNNSHLILLPLATIGIYVFSIAGVIVALDCWTIAEMISPNVLGRYRKVKTFLSLLANSPTRQEILRATKLYSDIVEKNGIKDYHSTSEFMKTFYDRLGDQDKKINEVLAEAMRQLGINRLAFEKEHNLRLQAERERDNEKQLNKKLTRRIVTLSGIIINLRAIIKKLKGE